MCISAFQHFSTALQFVAVITDAVVVDTHSFDEAIRVQSVNSDYDCIVYVSMNIEIAAFGRCFASCPCRRRGREWYSTAATRIPKRWKPDSHSRHKLCALQSHSLGYSVSCDYQGFAVMGLSLWSVSVVVAVRSNVHVQMIHHGDHLRTYANRR